MKTFRYSQFLIFMRGLSDYFANTTDSTGKNICRKHGVEHIGKTAYSIAIDSFLYSETGEGKYAGRIKSRVKRVLELQIETSDGFIFKPDFGNRWNMSQYVIDTGACVDMLGLVVERHLELFSEEEQKQIKAAISNSSDSYLVKASVNKAPTNQRLWGATGLATAYGTDPQENRKEALLASLQKSAEEIRADGSIPYVTDYRNYGMDESANDITPHYHSSHASYFWQALDVLPKEYTNEYAPTLIRATDFLISLHQSDWKKSIALETKHWYFLSQYEVASNSHDTHTFMRAYLHTGDNLYRDAALNSLSLLMNHQVESGAIFDHHGKGSNFQCPYFWSSHTAWLTKIADSLKQLDGTDFGLPKRTSKLYKEAGLAHLTDGKISIMIRGSKTPYGPRTGPKIGGGSLIYVGCESDNLKNKLQPEKITGNWHLKLRPSFLYVEFAKWTDIKAMVYYALIELRRGYIKGFIERSIIVLSRSVSFYQHYSSAFTIEVEMEMVSDQELIVKGGAISLADGTRHPGINLERRYRIQNGKLLVTERASHNAKQIPHLHYRFPSGSVMRSKNNDEMMVSYELC